MLVCIVNMSKSHQDCKKQIFRNIEDAKPKTTVIELPEENVEQKKTVSEPTEKDIPIISKVATIDEPKFNTTLCIKKKIREVEETKARKIKSLSDLSKSTRLTVDEKGNKVVSFSYKMEKFRKIIISAVNELKITKKLNFPHNQRLYKDLISLQLIDKPPPQTVTVFHEPIIKDRVPKLEEFSKLTQQEEYSISVNTITGTQPVVRYYNGFKLQQVIKSWHKVRPD